MSHKKIYILGGLLVIFLVFTVFYAATNLHQKRVLLHRVEELSRSKDALTQEAKGMHKLLSEKEEALRLAQKQNFQEDLVSAQGALKEVNEKLGQIIREKASLQNSNLILDNRLKNTTHELTKTLDELKQARETLMGIDSQYKVKLAQISENAKLKDEQLQKFQSRISEKEGSSADLQRREKDSFEAARTYQARLAELQKNVADLNQSLDQKEKELAMAQREASARPAARNQEGEARIVQLEREKRELESRINESNSRLSGQQENLKDLEKRLVDLNNTFADRELALKRKEKELKERTEEIGALKEELQDLRSASTYAARTGPLLAQTQKELQGKVQQLEKEKRQLEDRLEQAESMKQGAGKTSDAFSDRNFRILTEALVKKEEQIKNMEAELESLKREKASREGGKGLKEKRLQELEILVTTLTKQLGEYAGMLDRKDAELKAGNARIAALTQEIEAQKIASIALQKELAEARTRQEKTFQSLTQIMGMNAEAGVGGSSSDAASEGSWTGNPDAAAPELDSPAAGADAGIMRRKAEELKRRVEVLLEQKN